MIGSDLFFIFYPICIGWLSVGGRGTSMANIKYFSLFYLKAHEENRMSNENFVIGRWGKERQKFMTKNHPAESAQLMAAGRWNELALETDHEDMGQVALKFRT